MNRRNFIKNTALAAALVSVSPTLSASSNEGMKKKKIIFVWRGVTYADAFNAFKKFSITDNLSFHIQKTRCTNQNYSHAEGLNSLMSGFKGKLPEIIYSQKQDLYKITDLIQEAFKSTCKTQQIVYLHHSEIGHSSNKLYNEVLEEFFIELSKHFQADNHKVVVTADIGRNEKNNSMGGKDHSNVSCLETFAIYLGGKASTLAENPAVIDQSDVFKQKF
jgi:hypothetical protein